MELIKSRFAELKTALSGIKDYQISVKGSAEVALHTKNAPDAPKFKAEAIEDGATVNVTDVLLVGAAACAVAGICALICDIFE